MLARSRAFVALERSIAESMVQSTRSFHVMRCRANFSFWTVAGISVNSLEGRETWSLYEHPVTERGGRGVCRFGKGRGECHEHTRPVNALFLLLGHYRPSNYTYMNAAIKPIRTPNLTEKVL